MPDPGQLLAAETRTTTKSIAPLGGNHKYDLIELIQVIQFNISLKD